MGDEKKEEFTVLAKTIPTLKPKWKIPSEAWHKFEGTAVILVKVRLDERQHIVAMTGPAEEGKIKLSHFWVLEPSMKVLKDYMADRVHLATLFADQNVHMDLSKPIEAKGTNSKILLNGAEIRKTIQRDFANKKALDAKIEKDFLNGDVNISYSRPDPVQNPDFMIISVTPKINAHYQDQHAQDFAGKTNKNGDYIMDSVLCGTGENRYKKLYLTFKNVIINGKLNLDKLQKTTANDDTTTFKQLVADTFKHTRQPSKRKPKIEIEEPLKVDTDPKVAPMTKGLYNPEIGILIWDEPGSQWNGEITETPEVDTNPEGGHKPPEGLPNQKAPSPLMKKVGVR